MDRIQRCFDRKDWKNYTIYVHALKSSMGNIGARQISAMAKELEAAGKQGDERFIISHHHALLAAYEQLLAVMKASRTVQIGLRQEDIAKPGDESMEVLTEDQLDQIAAEFEDAAFAFDETHMIAVAKRLEQCSYHGHSFKDAVKTVMHKIHMSDYMSASEFISGLKNIEQE